MIEHQAQQVRELAMKMMEVNPRARKAALKKRLVETLIRRGHTKKRAQQLVKENWGK